MKPSKPNLSHQRRNSTTRNLPVITPLKRLGPPRKKRRPQSSGKRTRKSQQRGSFRRYKLTSQPPTHRRLKKSLKRRIHYQPTPPTPKSNSKLFLTICKRPAPASNKTPQRPLPILCMTARKLVYSFSSSTRTNV